MADINEIIEKIKGFNPSGLFFAKVKDIEFDMDLIKLCEANYCGAYGKNYSCPPYCGDTAELVEKIKSYENVLLFQSISPVEDSFDIDGWERAEKAFRLLTRKIGKLIREQMPEAYVLSAGGCDICKPCAVTQAKPCPFPDEAYSSLEAHAINVSQLSAAAGAKYINGINTVTYFGGVFYN